MYQENYEVIIRISRFKYFANRECYPSLFGSGNQIRIKRKKKQQQIFLFQLQYEAESKGEAESFASISLSEDGLIGISLRHVRNFHQKITRKAGRRAAQRFRTIKTVITSKPRRRCTSSKCKKRKIRKKKKSNCCSISRIPAIQITKSTIVTTTATVSTSIIFTTTTGVINSLVGVTTAGANTPSELIDSSRMEFSTKFFK